MHRSWFALALVAFTGAQQSRAPACIAPAHRAFDFWVGTWDVYGRRGAKVGENTIDTLYAHCVLRERYTTSTGYAGSSLNTYDATRGVWHQTWVDNGGLLLVIEGGLRNGSMVMEGETRASGKPVKNRITWTPIARDSVRQHWETWSDSAASWVTSFDGTYVRRQQSAVADSILRQADRFIAAIASRDIDQFVGLFAPEPDFIYVDAGNIYPDRAALRKAGAGFFARIRTFSGKWNPTKVLVLGPEAGAFTGVMHVEGADTAGKAIWPNGKIWTLVYQRRGGRWQIVQAHEANVPAPRPPAAAPAQ